MLKVDEILFGKALPLWFDGWVPQWAIEIMHFSYVWVYYLGPTAALGWAYFAQGDRETSALFLRLRRGLTFTLLGGYVMYLLIPVGGPLFLIGDQFRQPIVTQPVITKLVFDSLRYAWDCFPSLHTAVPWMLTLLLWSSVRRWARVL